MREESTGCSWDQKEKHFPGHSYPQWGIKWNKEHSYRRKGIWTASQEQSEKRRPGTFTGAGHSFRLRKSDPVLVSVRPWECGKIPCSGSRALWSSSTLDLGYWVSTTTVCAESLATDSHPCIWWLLMPALCHLLSLHFKSTHFSIAEEPELRFKVIHASIEAMNVILRKPREGKILLFVKIAKTIKRKLYGGVGPAGTCKTRHLTLQVSGTCILTKWNIMRQN